MKLFKNIKFKGKIVPAYHIIYRIDNPIMGYNEMRANLPLNEEGKIALDMLVNAFKQGKTFNITYSSSAKKYNVKWLIHHKTSVTGPDGYPDDDYLDRLAVELSKIGIYGPYEGKEKFNEGKWRVDTVGIKLSRAVPKSVAPTHKPSVAPAAAPKPKPIAAHTSAAPTAHSKTLTAWKKEMVTKHILSGNSFEGNIFITKPILDQLFATLDSKTREKLEEKRDILMTCESWDELLYRSESFFGPGNPKLSFIAYLAEIMGQLEFLYGQT